MLSLIATGMSNREIAEHLVVSEGTVKSHINHLLAKIDARDRAQAVTFAYQRGLAPATGTARLKVTIARNPLTLGPHPTNPASR